MSRWDAWLRRVGKGHQGGKGVDEPCYWPESFAGGSAVRAIITENVPMVAFW